ncbi:hypothetical protein [Amycolatopsis anabasis]|uniref:hypothetical protein n=1 Tax=Amycolatopsis anabasis TaxID=1840409 RepID=UPI00131E02A8|nr:hypothetical protein [Amycolatopsis anabasis]
MDERQQERWEQLDPVTVRRDELPEVITLADDRRAIAIPAGGLLLLVSYDEAMSTASLMQLKEWLNELQFRSSYLGRWIQSRLAERNRPPRHATD